MSGGKTAFLYRQKDIVVAFDWKAFLKGPVFIILVAVAAFLGGRYTTPESTKVVTVDKVVEVHHEQTSVTQQVNVEELLKKVQDKTKFIDRDVVRVVTIKPDGTRTETETDRSHIDSTQHTATNSETKVSQTAEIKKILDDYRAEDHTKVVEKTTPLDKWRAGIQVGYGENAGVIPTVPSWLLLGGFVEHQLIGKINIGAWGNTMKAGGLQLSIPF
jgi:hypothetical protein